MKMFFHKVLFIFIVCFFSSICLYVGYADTQELRYKVPKYENFDPTKEADRIEYIVNHNSVIELNTTDNKASLNGEEILNKNNEAKSKIQEYVSKLNKWGMYLNRDLKHEVVVWLRNMNYSDFAEIYIDNQNINKIADVEELKIILKDEDEYISVTREDISYIVKTYKEFKIQIKKQSDTYIVRFLNSDNSIIGKYGTDIKIGLPAKHSEQTVYLYRNNSQENWGGQYNELSNSIEIKTKFSGEYTVSSPQIVIKDISELNEYEQQAIRFMCVREYFSTNDNLFLPKQHLTRYDFAEALVRMFFALDDDKKCTFSDVDKEYYRYVAASQSDNIVQGFDDLTFRGKENVTSEQVIALAARTIHEKNGYVYPENIDKYMTFTDDNKISEWAKKEIALAIREGIYSKEMAFKFDSDITRKDAAIILYRLFMIMNNTPKPSENIELNFDVQYNHETFWNRTNAIIIICVTITINVVFLITLLYVKKKRNGYGVSKK